MKHKYEEMNATLQNILSAIGSVDSLARTK